MAVAFDAVFNGEGGWPVQFDWWKKTPKDYTEQMERFCVNCGVPYPLKGRLDSDGIDAISCTNLKKLKDIGSPKIKKGDYLIYNGGILKKRQPYNNFRGEFDYFNRIAAKYDMYLKQNQTGYLQPFLKDPC